MYFTWLLLLICWRERAYKSVVYVSFFVISQSPASAFFNFPRSIFALAMLSSGLTYSPFSWYPRVSGTHRPRGRSVCPSCICFRACGLNGGRWKPDTASEHTCDTPLCAIIAIIIINNLCGLTRNMKTHYICLAHIIFIRHIVFSVQNNFRNKHRGSLPIERHGARPI